MKEIKAIIASYEKAKSENKKMALATVVSVEGSSYRRPGARMLVTEDGRLTGAISGGCLEGHALRKALFAITKKQSMVVTYDTTDEDDAIIGVGLGCNGILQVLIEPVDASNTLNPVELLKKTIINRTDSVVVTIFSLDHKNEKQVGTSYILNEAIKDSVIADPLLAVQVENDARNVLDEKRSKGFQYRLAEKNVYVFIELIQPPVSLIIIGSGSDVQPLVSIAQVLGWDTAIINGRPNYVKQENYPGCKILVAKPETLIGSVPMDERTAVVLMTHNYKYDLAILKVVLNIPVAYIGSLGPKKKLDRMLAEIAQAEPGISSDLLHKIYGPAGLNIGADTPEEIALSIVAEIQSVIAHKEAGFLKHKTGPIHSGANHTFDPVIIA